MKKLITLVLAITILLGNYSLAQNNDPLDFSKTKFDGWLSIGDGTAYNYGPMTFDFYFMSLSEVIYPEEMIGENYGEITGLKWFYKVDAAPEVIDEGIQIWIGVVEEENLSVGWIPTSNFQMVYDGTFSMLMGENELELTLDNPFTYNGGNLAIYVHRVVDDEATIFGFDKQFKVTETGVQLYRSTAINDPNFEFIPDCQGNPPGVTLTYIPNIELNFSENPEAGQLSGLVYDDSSQPISDVIVSIPGLVSKKTGADGSFEIPYLIPGTYELTVANDFYFSETLEINVNPNNILTQDFNLVLNELVTLTGKVTSNNFPEGMENVVVKFTGNDEFETTTDGQGNYSFENILSHNDFYVKVTQYGYKAIYDTLQIDDTNPVIDFNLGEQTLTTYDVVAESPGYEVTVSWADPFTTEDKEFILDDGIAEWVSSFYNSGYAIWVGNYFPATGMGIIDEVHVRGFEFVPGQNEPLNIEIFNSDQESIFLSDEFLMGGDDMTVITFDPVTYYGGFYVMLKYDENGANVNGIGWDENGPNASTGYGRTHNPTYGLNFVDPYMQDCGFSSSRVYLIRALGNGTMQGEGKAAYGVSLFENNIQQGSINNGDIIEWEIPTTIIPDSKRTLNNEYTSDKSFVGYNIYSGLEEDSFEDFIKLNDEEISSLDYMDTDWVNNHGAEPFKYAITVVYTNGLESEPAYSNIMELEVGMNELNTRDIKVYPNPATDVVNINLNVNINQIEVFDYTGKLVLTEIINNTTYKVNTSNLNTGIYIFKITTQEGVFARQIIIE